MVWVKIIHHKLTETVKSQYPEILNSSFIRVQMTERYQVEGSRTQNEKSIAHEIEG